MPETITPAPAIDIQKTTSTIQVLADDASQSEKDIAALIHAYKAGGMSAVSGVLPSLVQDGEKVYTDLTTALPVLKAGYKTTEFWLIVAAIGINAGYSIATGKPLPLDINGPLAAIIAVYTAVRGLVKK